jgi:hypothetical protein
VTETPKSLRRVLHWLARDAVIASAVAAVLFLVQWLAIEQPDVRRQARATDAIAATQDQQARALTLLTSVQGSLQAYADRYIALKKTRSSTSAERHALAFAISLWRRGRVALAKGHYDKAISHLDSALSVLEQTCPVSDIRCLTAERLRPRHLP